MGTTSWGDWSKHISCEIGQKVNGFRLKVEGSHTFGDETALNGIQLSCADGTNSDDIPGPWGSWRSWVHCSPGNHVTEFDMRSERDDGSTNWDKVAASNVRMRCSDRAVIDGRGESWGSWEGYKSCPTNSYFCGVRAKIESGDGSNDDTALNRIEYQCCADKG